MATLDMRTSDICRQHDKKIYEVELRIITNERQLKELDEEYLRAFSPEGYKSVTSYNDYDAINGSRKEYQV